MSTSCIPLVSPPPESSCSVASDEPVEFWNRTMRHYWQSNWNVHHITKHTWHVSSLLKYAYISQWTCINSTNNTVPMFIGSAYKYSFILEWTKLVWTPALGLYLRGRMSITYHWSAWHNRTSSLCNYVPLFSVTQSNVDLRNITSDCYLNIVVSLDCYWTYLLEYV